MGLFPIVLCNFFIYPKTLFERSPRELRAGFFVLKMLRFFLASEYQSLQKKLVLGNCSSRNKSKGFYRALGLVDERRRKKI
jgi:hypothetical protein